MADATGMHSFEYDSLNRLTKASHPAGSAISNKQEMFSYEAVGNRLSDGDRSGYTYDYGNRLVSDSSFTYSNDANGNMVARTPRASGTSLTMNFDSSNRLIEADGPSGVIDSFKYNVGGARAEKVALGSTIRYIYDRGRVLALLDAGNNLIALYTNGTATLEPLSMRTAGKDYYLHSNHLGSVTAVTDSNAATVETIEYSAFGVPFVRDAAGGLHDRSTIGNPFLYTGVEYDAEFGLHHMGPREMDPQTGRFIQEDPLGRAGGGINLYTYVDDKPFLYNDPSGLSWRSQAGAFACGAAAGVLAAGLVTGAALGAAAVGVPAAVITGALGLGAIAGGYATGSDLYKSARSGNWDRVSYDVGTIAGGASLGAAGGGRALAGGVSGRPSAVPPSLNPFADISLGYRFRLSGRFIWWMAGIWPYSPKWCWCSSVGRWRLGSVGEIVLWLFLLIA